MFQVFIASTDAWSTGPESHSPLPCTQANSPLERLTPSSRYASPAAVTILLPDTRSSGAGPAGWGGVDGLDELGPGELGVGVTSPVQAVPFNENDAGTGLLPLHAPRNPTDVEAPVSNDPFQLMLAAETRAPDCVQIALQPCVTRWLAFGKSNAN